MASGIAESTVGSVAVASSRFGEVKERGELKEVTRVDFAVSSGFSCSFLSYGATVLSVKCPGKEGVEEITMQGRTMEEIVEEASSTYFGATCGRLANRVAHGKFELDGEEYSLAINNPPNNLHGGEVGFDKRVWEVVRAEAEEGGGAVAEFRLVSPDGEEGFPGTLEVIARYTLLAGSTDKTSSLKIEFEGKVEGKKTVVNLANHTYWNLSGDLKETASEHDLEIDCDFVLERTPIVVPTGEYVAIKDTPFDFRKPTRLGPRFKEVESVDPGHFDHCYTRGDDTVMKRWVPPSAPTPIATLSHASSGRRMSVSTTQPAVQLYTGYFLPEPEEADKRAPPFDRFRRNGAVCLETQHFPDSVHHPHFPSTELSPGEHYKETTIHTFEWE